METYILKKELFWHYDSSDNAISLLSTNRFLKKIINTNKNREVFLFLKYISKPRTIEEIYQFDFLSETEIKDIFNFLIEKEYLYKNQSIEDYEKRLESFINSFPGVSYSIFKEKMRKQSVLVIGLGTAGSYLPEILVKSGISYLTLIDYDYVEEKNLFAQNYQFKDIGRNKAKVILDDLGNFKTDINVITSKVTSYEDLRKLVDLNKISYLVNCADDYWLQEDILKNIYNDFTDIKIIHTGYAVLQQTAHLINKDNYKSELVDIQNNPFRNEDYSNFIISNSDQFLIVCIQHWEFLKLFLMMSLILRILTMYMRIIYRIVIL